jgi:transaldolase
MYVSAFAAPQTINTMPEATLRAFADHGEVTGTMPLDGGDADATLEALNGHGIDVDALASTLQREGADAFVKSWQRLLQRIEEKSRALEA